MKNRWNQKEANKLKGDLLKLRVYTSRLQGQEEDLVLHGGGNTSVKIREKNVFGENEDILYVKGSGWDLATIETEGFAPVRLSRLLQLAQLDTLSDLDMVKYQRSAMTNPNAPNPSVEAILHALIPFRFVDHTHADAVVTVSNTPTGRQMIHEVYGDHMLIVPYVMPGFILAKTIDKMTKKLDWSSIEGMILLNHGIFTFHEDARVSYDNMIKNVSLAEKYLRSKKVVGFPSLRKPGKNSFLEIASLRKGLCNVEGSPVLCRTIKNNRAVAFSSLPDLRKIASRGPLTPDHIIRTKRKPLIAGQDQKKDLENYVSDYYQYFERHNPGHLTCLRPTPKWIVRPNRGTIVVGNTVKAMNIIADITDHTMKAIYQAEQLGGWKALPKKDLFEMEYWSLEQAKLAKAGKPKLLQGKVALVTGAASGIGKACVENLAAKGAAVVALDINDNVTSCFDSNHILGLKCDVTRNREVQQCVERTIELFGGLDLLILNAGIFPRSQTIDQMDDKIWNKSIELNLTSQQKMMQVVIPYMKQGVDPAIVIIGSKNVPAPGPGASAYSVAKAGLNQLGRVASMELGEDGIRVNMLHPNAVYDTGIWTDEVLEARARHYGLSVEEYKTNNVLKKEVTSRDVAELAVTMLGPVFAKTTGAQIPIDGGNERII